jgi:hypothetical protein
MMIPGRDVARLGGYRNTDIGSHLTSLFIFLFVLFFFSMPWSKVAAFSVQLEQEAFNGVATTCQNLAPSAPNTAARDLADRCAEVVVTPSGIDFDATTQAQRNGLVNMISTQTDICACFTSF